ncbi:MAG: hypothetical protein Q9225_001884 [Loekoesia sp. 1 TL-2023]
MRRPEADTEITPRPNKRRLVQDDLDPPQQFSPRPSQSDASSELESHHSGRLSPTKQLAFLEDREDPVIYCDFNSARAEMSHDVQKLRADADELASLTAPDEDLEAGERARFCYPWANDFKKRRKTGKIVSLSEVKRLTTTAITCEDRRSHENTWNEKVHLATVQVALASSAHAAYLDVASVKTAAIDPPNLADEALPKRVVDYAIVLLPEERLSRAWKKLQPLPNAGIKSWNHTTTSDLRSTPIAVNIETKAPNKSWTDGKAQLGIWTATLFKRLLMLQEPGREELEIPAMPLLVAQGHDWHLLIIKKQPSSSARRGTVIWQKIDIGSTRSCFDCYKLLAILHLVADWAYTIWRPWFCELIEWMDR